MMNNTQAILRLQNRDRYLVKKIDDLKMEGRPTYWLEQDRESIALAIAAIEYVIAMAEYEQSATTKVPHGDN